MTAKPALTIDELLDALTLEPIGRGRYRAINVQANSFGAVFGGQLLAQSVVAGATGQDGMAVKTVHTVFSRGVSPASPIEIDVEAMHDGRNFASRTVTISQDDQLCTRSLVVLSRDEPDTIRHGDAPARASTPHDAKPRRPYAHGGAWETRVVDGVDLADPDLVGPAELDVWSRFPDAPDDPVVSQALLAYATDAFLVGTTLRPHEGLGLAVVHVTVTTGVVSHTLTFHEPFAASEWLLLSHRSPYAGRGRGHGRADVFRADGQLVASCSQDTMIRAKPRPPSTAPTVTPAVPAPAR